MNYLKAVMQNDEQLKINELKNIIYIGEKLIGVLDLDSFEYGNFDEIDKVYLEKAVELIIASSDII